MKGKINHVAPAKRTPVQGAAFTPFVIGHSSWAILPLLLLLLALPLEAQTIITKTLDVGSGGTTGLWTSQAIVNGNPAIAYSNDTDRSLMFARNSAANGSGTWSITTVDSIGDVGQYTSLAVVNGKPAISYYDATSGDLKYVRANDANGTSWDTPVTVDSAGNVGLESSLAVVNGNPAISYRDRNNTDLKYVRANDASGTGWGTPVIVDSTVVDNALYPSLEVVNGNPAISYHGGTSGALKYVRANDASGTSWGTPVTVDSTAVRSVSSLAVVNGNPAISYNASNHLTYVRANDASGTSWGTPVTVDAGPGVGSNTSLAVVNGNPAISYVDLTIGLKYVRANDASGTSWGTLVTVDSVGNFTSLVVVNGIPAISYWGGVGGDLKYVRANDASGMSWRLATTVDAGVESGDVGRYTSQAIVDGNPAISYMDETKRDLKYVRANDASGMSWATPVTVVGSGMVGYFTSLAVVNGSPAISYVNGTNADLKYVRANDASGTSWGTAVAVDAIGSVGHYSSLVVVDGNPAIGYQDRNNGNLKYARANDASGTSWSASVTIATTGDVGYYISLAVVNGNPAISYYDLTNGDLKYVRANDASGTNWGTLVTVDSDGNVGSDTSLAVVNGNPAISYYDGTNADLKYVQATDASGTNWGPPITVDSIGSVGFYTSLAVVNGNPAISYYDGLGGDLKWATILTPIPTPTPTSSPTPTPLTTISGTVVYCSNPSLSPVTGVTLSLTGDTTDSTLSDGSGNYSFSEVSGGNYTVMPSKAALPPASTGINTVDVISVQRHFLNLGPPLAGCQLTAADVSGDSSVNTMDVIAIQRFFLGLSTGVANTGMHQFTPANRTYAALVTDQTGQNYDTLVFGDVAGSFVEGVGGPPQTAAGDGTSPGELPATVAAVILPEIAIDQSRSTFIAAVTTSAIDANNKLVGFQGDFTFDERVVTFQPEPVQKAGITGGNWNVSGNVLSGPGPIRTLRISAYSNDFTPLKGSGTLFELRMTRVNQGAQATHLLWAAAPDQFIFIDADLKTQKPSKAAPGSVTPSAKHK